jgi:DNA-binding SARP family transcriptional activator
MAEQAVLKVYTLGRLTIERNGEPLTDFVSQKAPTLFAYLLCHPREHPRDVLAEMFWSDTSGNQALKNLRTVLSSLQKSLGDFLDVTRQTLAIADQERIWLDVNELDRQLDTIAQRQQRPYSPRRLITDLENALTLYQGDFLVGVRTNNAPELDTWVTLEQERLRSRAANAMFQLVELSLASGAYRQGIEYGRKLLGTCPACADDAPRGKWQSHGCCTGL